MDPEEIQAADDPVEVLRRLGGDYTENFPVVPNEYSNWIDEHLRSRKPARSRTSPTP